MNATTYSQTKKAIRIAATVILAAFGAVCLYAVIFMHRPDHLLTTAAYAVMAWAINHKEDNTND